MAGCNRRHAGHPPRKNGRYSKNNPAIIMTGGFSIQTRNASWHRTPQHTPHRTTPHHPEPQHPPHTTPHRSTHPHRATPRHTTPFSTYHHATRVVRGAPRSPRVLRDVGRAVRGVVARVCGHCCPTRRPGGSRDGPDGATSRVYSTMTTTLLLFICTVHCSLALHARHQNHGPVHLHCFHSTSLPDPHVLPVSLLPSGQTHLFFLDMRTV